MIHQDRNQAKRFDSPERNARFTDLVYQCDGRTRSEVDADLVQTVRAFEPEKNPLGFLSRGTFQGMGKIRRKSPVDG